MGKCKFISYFTARDATSSRAREGDAHSSRGGTLCGRNVGRRGKREMSLGIEGTGPPQVLKETSLGERSIKDRVERPTVGPERGVGK